MMQFQSYFLTGTFAVLFEITVYAKVTQSSLVTSKMSTMTHDTSTIALFTDAIQPSFSINTDVSTIGVPHTVIQSTVDYVMTSPSVNISSSNYLTGTKDFSTYSQTDILRQPTSRTFKPTDYRASGLTMRSSEITGSSLYTLTKSESIQATKASSMMISWSGSVTSQTSSVGQASGPPSISTDPKCVQNGNCCKKALRQIPSYIKFEENQTPGTILVPMFGVEKVKFRVEVLYPPELRGFLGDYFNITRIGLNYMLQIEKYVDIEEMYLKSNKNSGVTSFQLQIHCVDDLPSTIPVPPRTINITILDVDDTMPVFQGIEGHKHCVVPVYTTNTSEDFVGELQINPTQICAVDGDLTRRNNISYRVMHGEPFDYDLYFDLNFTDGTVSKTKMMNSSNPNKYVLFVEAVEDSPDQQNRVAILSIKVVPNVVISEEVHKVNPTLKLSLEVLSVVVISGFVSAIVFLVCHRKRMKDQKVKVDDEIRDYKLLGLNVYESSSSSLSSDAPEIQPVASPSTIFVTPAKPNPSPYAAVRNKKFIQRERSPLDTASRPAWNAPKPKSKPVRYNPFTKKGK